MYSYKGKTQVSTPKGLHYRSLYDESYNSSYPNNRYISRDVPTTKYSTPKEVHYRSLEDESSHSSYPNNRYISRDDTLSSTSLYLKSKINYGAIDEKSSNSSHKSNRYVAMDVPPLNYINNYEVKCIYRINMNNYYKNINIYNYKKKFNII